MVDDQDSAIAMNDRSWEYGYSSSQGQGFGDESPMPGHLESVAYPLFQVDDYQFPSSVGPHESVQNAQFDPRELHQFSRDLNEAPRDFLQAPHDPTYHLPNHGQHQHSLPAVATVQYTPNVYGVDYAEHATGSAAESGYASFNPPIDPEEWRRTSLQLGLQGFTAGQFSPQGFQENNSPSIVSDPTADRVHGSPLQRRTRSLRSRGSVPPCPCGKQLKNASDARQVSPSRTSTQNMY